MNVVSTSPSATEILYALGVEPVAASHACDYPPEVEEKPRIDASNIEGETSGERHEQLEAASDDGHVYSVDAEKLRAVEPDLIVTQEVCGVCAVDTTVVDGVLADLEVDPEVVGLSASRLADLYTCIRDVARATGREDEAEALIAELQARLASIEARVPETGPRVTVMEWMDPIHIAGNWVPELVSVAGGEYGLADPGQSSMECDWSAVVDYDPEVVVVAPCSCGVEQTRNRLVELAERPGWDERSAVRAGEVYAFDGSSYLTRWSPRLVDAAERLASVFHPDAFGPPPGDVGRLSTPATS